MPSTTYPTRYYDTRTDGTAAGFFASHTDLALQAEAFALRQAGLTFPEITDRLNLQHWDHAQAAVRAEARRTGQTARVSHTRAATRRTTGAVLLNRRFGVEIETARGAVRGYGSMYEVAAESMRNHGLDAAAEGYNHSTAARWKVVSDGSITGVEAVSPILRGDAGYQEMRSAMTALKAVGFAPGGGVHVHHDIRDLDQAGLALLVNNLKHTQSALLAYLPRSRRSASWCQPLRQWEWQAVEQALANGQMTIADHGRRYWSPGWSCGLGRYFFFNFQTVGCYGTVEFRGHAASLNPVKLRTWIAVGQAIIEYTRTGGRFDTPQTVESMLATLTDAAVLDRDAARRFAARAAANA